jgi:hypothetical protein
MENRNRQALNISIVLIMWGPVIHARVLVSSCISRLLQFKFKFFILFHSNCLSNRSRALPQTDTILSNLAIVALHSVSGTLGRLCAEAYTYSTHWTRADVGRRNNTMKAHSYV